MPRCRSRFAIRFVTTALACSSICAAAAAAQTEQLPEGVTDIWFVGYATLSVSGARSRYDAYMEFEDGSVTRDIDTVMAEGLEQSRSQNPDDWGIGRAGPDGLEVKWGDSDKWYRGAFSDIYFAEKANEGQNDHSLSGCYSSSSGATLGFGATVSSAAINTWCFTPSGQFSNNRSLAIGGDGGSGSATGGRSAAASASNETGVYHVDGHIIRIQYNDGRSAVTTFAYHNSGSDDALLLGGAVYRR